MVGFVVFHYRTRPVLTESHHHFTHICDYVKSPTVVSVCFERTIQYFSAFKLIKFFLTLFSLYFAFHDHQPLKNLKSLKASASDSWIKNFGIIYFNRLKFLQIKYMTMIIFIYLLLWLNKKYLPPKLLYR